jgi:hypothetical protein
MSDVLRDISTNWRILPLGVLLLGVLTLVVQTIRSWYRLRHFKGPTLAAFSDLWLIRHVPRGTIHLDLFEVTEKYGLIPLWSSCKGQDPDIFVCVGSLARIGSNTLVTTDPDLLRRIQAVRTPYKRSDWYNALKFDPSRENVLSQRDDEKHGVLRAKMAAGVNVSCLTHLCN